MSITSSNVSRDGVFNSMGRKDPSVIAFANNLSGSANPTDHPRSHVAGARTGQNR